MSQSGTVETMIRIVANAPTYYEFIRTLRNDPRVQPGFLEVVRITTEQQNAYMAKLGGRYLVCLVDDVPAGYVGSIEGDIRVCTHPDFQGRGVGAAMIHAIMDLFPESYARLKPGNTSSRALFKACGFQRAGEIDGLHRYLRPRVDGVGD